MPKPCSRCGRSYGADAWGELRVVDQITSERVREFLSAWQDSDVVEVRACACGQALARKVGRSSGAAAC